MKTSKTKVLIADDDPVAIMLLGRVLSALGYAPVIAVDGEAARQALIADRDIRIVISDWEMPRLSGVDLCRWIRRSRESSYTYAIMLTNRDADDDVVEGLSAGADDFLAKPVNPRELEVRLRNAVRVLALDARDATIFALAKLAETRDTDTGEHLLRTREYCRLLASRLAHSERDAQTVDAEFIRLLWLTSPLHDIGKVGIPDAILRKPGSLTAEEYEVMKQHCVIGAQTLDAAIDHAPSARFLEIARDIAIAHHERWDGLGYPAGLAGEAIPLCARIMAVADVYDALRSPRVYKPAFSHDRAVEIIAEGRGTQFDPQLTDAFIDINSDFARVDQTLRVGPIPHAGTDRQREAA